jgi:hypothetical protein
MNIDFHPAGEDPKKPPLPPDRGWDELESWPTKKILVEGLVIFLLLCLLFLAARVWGA